MDKAALEQLISRLNWWMGISTVAVAVGILGEYLFEAIAERKHRRRSEMVLSILFGALVLGGVVGEYIFGSKLSTAASELQRQADLDIAGFNLIARLANKSASEADARAAKANERAATAELHAADANKKAESFRLDISSANERAAEAERHAAEAKLDLAKFKAPRIIAPKEQEFLSKIIGGAGTPFDISVGTDEESIDLGRTIISILSLAKWVQVAVKGPLGLSNSSPLIGIAMASGVHVEIDSSRRLEWGNTVETLVGLLRAENIDAEGAAVIKGVEPNAIHITVGTKPRN